MRLALVILAAMLPVAAMADAASYCRLKGDDDTPKQTLASPAEVSVMRKRGDLEGSGILEWRCMDLQVYFCTSGNSPICGKMSPYDGLTAIRQACKEEPNADFLPAIVTGRFPATWSCVNGQPKMKLDDNAATDRRGFVKSYWTRF